jgi:hypothetical protein
MDPSIGEKGATIRVDCAIVQAAAIRYPSPHPVRCAV